MGNLYSKKWLCLLLMVFVLTSCGNAKNVEGEKVMEIPKNASSADISAQIGYSPSQTEKNSETGISTEIYDAYTFAGHEGQISFYYKEDGTVLYYKWFLSEEDKENANKIYSDVCQALAGSYGDGTQNNSDGTGLYTTSYTSDTQQIIAQLQGNESGYEISYMVVG